MGYPSKAVENIDAPLPHVIENEEMLDELLSRPTARVVALMRRLKGDLIILGIGGKIGTGLGLTALRATRAAGIQRRVIGVSRFSDPSARSQLEAAGLETIACDLLDQDAVSRLPKTDNVLYLVGRKFGTGENVEMTWATNVLVPANVSRHFSDSRIVAFSTGCVYPLVPPIPGGCTEECEPQPVGEYAQSCLARERIFQYWSRTCGTRISLLRLNYAIDLRYGVLYDIGQKVYHGEPIDLTVSHVNVIWQGDVNRQTLLSLEHCASPPTILNITGPETASVRYIAETFGRIFGRAVKFRGVEGEGRMYLSNASKAAALFGYPSVPLLTMIRWQAAWIQQGGRSLSKPTHFEVTDGKF